MADQYLTQLSSLASPANGDLLYVVDVSDTTDSSGGTSKKMAVSELYTLDSISVDTISEKTAANGVTIDGVNIKDSVIKIDTINEKTGAAGVTIDGVKLKDSAVITDTLTEKTAANGIAVDGLTIKDAGFAIGSDADGDVYYRASGALARLAKGSAGQVLTMNSGASAPEWTDAGTTNAKFSAYANANQTLASTGTWYVVEANTEDFDIGSDYNTGTYQFTAPVTGYYSVSAHVTWLANNVAGSDDYLVRIRKNATSYITYRHTAVKATQSFSVEIGAMLKMTAADTLDIGAQSEDTANTVVQGQPYATRWSAHLLST